MGKIRENVCYLFTVLFAGAIVAAGSIVINKPPREAWRRLILRTAVWQEWNCRKDFIWDGMIYFYEELGRIVVE